MVISDSRSFIIWVPIVNSLFYFADSNFKWGIRTSVPRFY
jgi:hypothetical protein